MSMSIHHRAGDSSTQVDSKVWGSCQPTNLSPFFRLLYTCTLCVSLALLGLLSHPQVPTQPMFHPVCPSVPCSCLPHLGILQQVLQPGDGDGAVTAVLPAHCLL